MPGSPEWKISVAGLANRPRSVTFDSDPMESAGIKDRFELQSISRFSFNGEISKGKGDLFVVKGMLEAQYVQTCVVTLKPVAGSINTEIIREFQRESKPRRRKKTNIDPQAEDLVVDVEDDDPPDNFTGTEIDFGAAALEEFGLELDPYPRHPDAGDAGSFVRFEDGDNEAAGRLRRPFADLARMKTGDGKN